MDIEHVIIRQIKFFAGSKEHPAIHVFVDTRTNRLPVDEARLHPGDVVWLKWAGGPIVASARIASWHTGKVRGGYINGSVT